MSEARQRALRPVYLVLGEEPLLARAVITALKTATLDGGVPGLNEDQLTAGECQVEAALQAAQTLPMMAKRRWVLVRSVERWESGAEGKGKVSPLDRLADYVKAPSASSTLVLVATKLDNRRRLVTAAKADGCVVECDALPPKRLPSWIEREVRERGCTLTPAVADLIADLAGPELGPVADAVERLCLYVGNGGEVTEEAVGECVVRLRLATIWKLVDAFTARDAPGALAALADLYDPSDRGIRLVGTLARSTRQLLRFESALRAGARPAEAAQAAGLPPFKADQVARQVKQLSRLELERWLEILRETDRNLKGGSRRPQQAVLEHALLRITTARP